MGPETAAPSSETDSARDARLAEILEKMRVLLTGEPMRSVPPVADAPKTAPSRPRTPEAELESFPHVVVDRLMAGMSPVQVYREHRGMTREALADAVGISIEALAALEAGQDMIVLRKIAAALKINVRTLI